MVGVLDILGIEGLGFKGEDSGISSMKYIGQFGLIIGVQDGFLFCWILVFQKLLEREEKVGGSFFFGEFISQKGKSIWNFYFQQGIRYKVV